MSESYDHIQLNHEADSWAKSRYKDLNKALTAQFNATIGSFTTVSDFSLTELGLCHAIEKVDLPNGYKMIPFGSIDIWDPSQTKILKTTGHSYAINNDTVLCIAFGQFFDTQFGQQSDLSAGDRVKIYKSIAPNLITLLPHGNALLHGSQKEILKKLALNYR